MDDPSKRREFISFTRFQQLTEAFLRQYVRAHFIVENKPLKL